MVSIAVLSTTGTVHSSGELAGTLPSTCQRCRRRRLGRQCQVTRLDRRGVVEVLFTSEKLKRALSSHRTMRKAWGKEGAKQIALRLQQLAAAPGLADMRDLPGRCHELSNDRSRHLAVDVHHPYRLIFRPSADPAPSKADGGLDWTAVDSITVTEIVNYHQ